MKLDELKYIDKYNEVNGVLTRNYWSLFVDKIKFNEEAVNDSFVALKGSVDKFNQLIQMEFGSVSFVPQTLIIWTAEYIYFNYESDGFPYVISCKRDPEEDSLKKWTSDLFES
jgi:hypothetical protein